MPSTLSTTPVSQVDFGLDLGPDDVRLPGGPCTGSWPDCPSSHIAKAQIAVAVQRLLDRLPGLTLTDAEAGAPTGTVMRGPRTLDVTWAT
jgi:hypothetical protein